MAPLSADSSRKVNAWLLVIAAAACILYLVYLLRYVLLPFVVAGALAYVSQPMVRWMQIRLRLPRRVALMAPLIVLAAALAAVGWAIKSYFIPQITSLLSDQTAILEHFFRTLFRGQSIAIGGKSYDSHAVAASVTGIIGSQFQSEQALGKIEGIIELMMGLILTLVLLIYFLFDGARIARTLLRIVPPPIRPQVLVVARRSGPVIHAYVRGVMIITLYATALTYLVARFVLHVDHALILALAVGLLELIPVIGPVLAVVILCLVALGQISFWGIIGVAVFTTVLRLSIDQFVGPVVLGRSMRLAPPLIIFAFMAGAAIWGVLGVVVAIPAAAIGKIILEEAYGEGSPAAPSDPSASDLIHTS